MLPGLTRTAAQPASIAAKMYLLWKWMSAITGIWLCGRSRQRVGVDRVGHGDADDLAAGRGELGDLLQRRVDVGGDGRRHRLHADRRAAADQHAADVELPGRAALGEPGGGSAGMPERDGSVTGLVSSQVIRMGLTMSAPSENTVKPTNSSATA